MLKFEQAHGESFLVVRGFVELILRDEIGLSVVEYIYSIIVAQNGFKRVLEVYLI